MRFLNNTIKNKYLILGFLLLFAFYFFSREVKHGFLKQADFDTTVKIQDKMPKRFDGVWEDLTIIIEPMPSIVVLGVLTVLAAVDWRQRKIRLRALAIPLLFALLVFAEIYGKSVVHHPSPPYFMIKHPTAIFPKHYINEQFSYPSGHTARATFFTLVLFLTIQQFNNITKRRKVWFIVGLGVYVGLVGISRIYLGHHWLSDVLGGFLLGSGFGLLTLVSFPPIITSIMSD